MSQDCIAVHRKYNEADLEFALDKNDAGVHVWDLHFWMLKTANMTQRTLFHFLFLKVELFSFISCDLPLPCFQLCRSPLLAIWYQKQPSSSLSLVALSLFMCLPHFRALQRLLETLILFHLYRLLYLPFSFISCSIPLSTRLDWVVEKQVDKGWSSHLCPKHPPTYPTIHTQADMFFSDVWQNYL